MLILIQVESLPAPRNWEEMAIYMLSGAVAFAFGWLRTRQKRNERKIENLQTTVRLQELDRRKPGDDQ